jgi:SPP1 family predicted phage head-tail adaptor
MNKLFNNKSSVDPGRLRYTLTFSSEQTTQNEYGNSEVTYVTGMITKAAKLQIGSYDQYAIEAGASMLRNDVYFVIRYRTDWTPTKDMVVGCDGKTYKLHAVIELDQPVHYWKLLCIWQG